MNKILPKSSDINKKHKSIFIKNYLKYAYNNRTLRLSTVDDQYMKIINNEKVSSEKTKKIFTKVNNRRKKC